jgi:hypothetical protein
MKIILMAMITLNCFAGFTEVSEDSLYNYKQTKVSTPRKSKVIRKSKVNKELDALLAKDKAIYELLKKQEKHVIVRKHDDKVTALTRVRGTLLNSVLAMNVKPSKFIVRITDNEHDLYESEIRCIGYSFEKRVPAKCDLLVRDDEEYKVDIDIWDLDGAEGIIADHYYSGEEKSFLTSSFASFLGSTFSVAKNGINTPIGTITQNNTKNQLMDGLLGISDNAKQKIMESGERNLTISYVNSGKEVLIFFNKTLNLRKQ